MRLGIFLIGVCGQVGTTTVVGLKALARNLVSKTGLVTALPEFDALDLPALGQIAVGGCDIRRPGIANSAQEIAEAGGAISWRLFMALQSELDQSDPLITPGISYGLDEATLKMAGIEPYQGPARPEVQRLIRDILAFQSMTKSDQVVVVNVASTEAPVSEEAQKILDDEAAFELALDDAQAPLPPSTLYARAALEAGCPYINFTPSVGAACQALQNFAQHKKIPTMGSDGKTGETLVKTVLAPMFVARHLKLLSWEGHNLLGNRDGQILNHPANKESKVLNKDQALTSITQDPDLHSRVRIDYTPSLDDWKTAWDFIHFAGFLDTKMSMQFTWQGCDSALAAPLVIDLARLAAFSHAQGESGRLSHLAGFFKNPEGVSEQSFMEQWAMLLEWVKKHQKSLASIEPQSSLKREK